MKRIIALLIILGLMLSVCCSCSLPIISDFIKSDESLGKTNNTAVAIAAAMDQYLIKKKKESLSLYGMELILNSDGNGTVKLYYAAKAPQDIEYTDLYVGVVNSKTGHVERFSKAKFEDDGILPYEMVKSGVPFSAANLPIDSEKAISVGSRKFSADSEFHYDYVQMKLSAPNGQEQYEIQYISMLNDKIYHCTVDAVSGTALASSVTKE